MFEIAKFYWQKESARPRRITVPNVVKISQSVAEILCDLWTFLRWLLPPSWIFKLAKFYCLAVPGVPSSITCQISSQSVILLPRCCDFSNFQDGGRPRSWMVIRYLGFVWAYFDHPRRVLGSLYHSAKFGYDRWSSFEIWTFSLFGACARKIAQ